MKERPILFSAPMVRALLEGRKTMTRRIAKPVKHPDWGNLYDLGALVKEHEPQHVIDRACPYGQPGDRLWVRETFQPLYADGYEYRSVDWKTGKGYAISYPATDGVQEFVDPDDNITCACKPSIHMPRWASRILLEIVSVRVERLQDISEQDAISEGSVSAFIESHTSNEGLLASDQFFCLWDQINGLGAWQKNPWVWVVEFKRIEAAH